MDSFWMMKSIQHSDDGDYFLADESHEGILDFAPLKVYLLYHLRLCRFIVLRSI